MEPINRRHILKSSVGSATAMLAGCLDIGSGTISLALMNRDEQAHDLEIEMRSESDTILTETYELDVDGEILDEDVVDGGEYVLVATVDDIQAWVSKKIEMNNCDEQVVTIGIRSDENIVIGMNNC